MKNGDNDDCSRYILNMQCLNSIPALLLCVLKCMHICVSEFVCWSKIFFRIWHYKCCAGARWWARTSRAAGALWAERRWRTTRIPWPSRATRPAGERTMPPRQVRLPCPPGGWENHAPQAGERGMPPRRVREPCPPGGWDHHTSRLMWLKVRVCPLG